MAARGKMRRSAAPSALAEGVRAKRAKFQPPLATNVVASNTAVGSVPQQCKVQSNCAKGRPLSLPSATVNGENARPAYLTLSPSSQGPLPKDEEGCSALQRALKDLKNGSSEICQLDTHSSSTANGILPMHRPATMERTGKGGTVGSKISQGPRLTPPPAPPTPQVSPKVTVGVAQHEVGSALCVGQGKKESGGAANTPSESCKKYFSVMW